MGKNNHLEKWVDALKKRDLEQFVAILLEATKPMNFIFAQLVYIGQPLINGHISTGAAKAMANMLEDENKTNLFISNLRGTNE